MKSAAEFLDDIQCCSSEGLRRAAVHDRDREVRAAVLAEVAERFPSHEPTGEDNDSVCANCDSMVTVNDGCEWSDGDVCDRCAESALAEVEAFVNKQLSLLAGGS